MSYALVEESGGERIVHVLRDGAQTVGRSSESDIPLGHSSVSRHHARLIVDGARVTVVDLGSRNGTFVDGRAVSGEADVPSGAEIAFASVSMLLIDRDASRASGCELDASAVVSAIMEPSDLKTPGQGRGSGSSLFRVLADAGAFLVSERPLDGIYEDVLDLVERAVACDRALVLVRDDKGEPVVRASRIKSASDGDRLVLSRTMVGRVLDEGVALLTTDAQSDPRFEGRESVVAQGIRAAMAVPLHDNECVIGLLYADTTDPAFWYNDDELRAFTSLANLIAVKITQSRLAAAEEQRKRLERELSTARDILSNILPAELEDADGYEVCVFHESCYEVGGDLYDVRHFEDGRSLVLVGDVAGKGLGAALLVSSIVPMAHALLEGEAELVDAVARLNRQVWRTTDPVRYATLFVGMLDRPTGRLVYVNAGHNPPYLIAPDGGVEEVLATGMPVGMIEAAPFSAGEVTLVPGSVLAAFSDGVTEAEGGDGAFYEEPRLRAALDRVRSRCAREIVSGVLDDVREFVGEHAQSDDVTLLVVRRLPT
jgi:sigma-B regulation protein RsbU (phosphoserine phosphatase)